MQNKQEAPISHVTYKHLNKRVTILGYPTLLGALLIALALFLPILSISLKVMPLIILSAIYLILFIPLTIKQVKNVKERKLDVFDLIMVKKRLERNYEDNTNILHIIRKPLDNEKQL